MTTEPAWKHRACALLLPLALAACAPAPPPVVASLQAQPWALPAQDGASQPDFSTAPDGSLLLSWVGPSPEGAQLQFARFAAQAWSEPREIASGDGFGSSVDTPHLRQTADGALWAQWLRKPPQGGHARDVVLARSGDGGARWSAPQLVNLDATPTEHGFVSMWPAGGDRLGLAWLDGRHRQPAHSMEAMAPGAHAGHDAGMTMGATMLRAMAFDAAGQRHEETAVDLQTCDCCQTDVALTPRGAMLVYRDHEADETRDIAVSRREATGWSKPRRVHADGWIMPACPINGPSIAAAGDTLAVAWYTAAGGQPSVRLALARDGGDRFDAPVVLATGAPVRGNVDVQLDADAAWASWLAEAGDGLVLRLARVDRHGGAVLRQDVARLSVRGRPAPPRLALHAGAAYLVWEDHDGDAPKLAAARVTPQAR